MVSGYLTDPQVVGETLRRAFVSILTSGGSRTEASRASTSA
jgi:hypothetical protein